MFPQCFTRYDWCRSYVLPADVAATIPLIGNVGMYGAHNAARGLLVEVCRHTGATPVALHYHETVLADGDIEGDIVVNVTATARRPNGTTLVVATTSRTRRRPPDHVGDWTLTVDGVHLVEQNRVWPPSPPMQGHMVACLTRRPASKEADR
jgi:hypothetical protein